MHLPTAWRRTWGGRHLVTWLAGRRSQGQRRLALESSDRARWKTQGHNGGGGSRECVSCTPVCSGVSMYIGCLLRPVWPSCLERIRHALCHALIKRSTRSNTVMFVIIYTKFVSTYVHKMGKRENRLFPLCYVCVLVSRVSMYLYIIYLYPLCFSVGSCLASDGGASE